MIRNHYAIYQLKRGAETKHLCFRPYQELKEKKIAVRAENYEQVFHTGILPGDTAETIWRRFLRQPPKTFRGYHSLSTSDVIVINKEGAITSFYVESGLGNSTSPIFPLFFYYSFFLFTSCSYAFSE